LVMERVLYGCVAFRSNAITTKIMRTAIAEVLAISASPGQRDTPPFFRGLFAGFALMLTVIATLAVIPFWEWHGDKFNALEIISGKMMSSLDSQTSPESKTIHNVRGVYPTTLFLKDAKVLEAFLGVDIQKDLEDAISLHFPALLWRDLPDGVVMLQMGTLPAEPGSSQEWTAFFWGKFVPTGPSWVVFWRPTLYLENIALGESHPDVVKLQQLLEKQGIFGGGQDGVFGPALMNALATFQRRVGLVPTGRPSAMTMFQLRFGTTRQADNS
ncbi:MAG: peptidoglycan-binding domain-containing protein, partial [Desulfoplanes sp.]